MNQDKISKFIKEVRMKNKWSQAKFGEKYGVTYQAVSKWENGKNLPDISILKEICNDNKKDINELLNDNQKFKYQKKKKIRRLILLFIMIIIFLAVMIILKNKNNHEDEFQFKTIKTTCDNFELYGSIAYNDNKTSIYISNITYCGKDNETKYKEIECTLYESYKNTKTKIDSYHIKTEGIMLEEFLKQVKFNVDHYSNSCKMYKENGLLLEIKAIDFDNKTIFYSIPLELEENCK